MSSITHTFKGKKPSKAQIIKIATELSNAGFSSFSIVWGENYIDFERYDGVLIGNGWIKDISGYDTATLINNAK